MRLFESSALAGALFLLSLATGAGPHEPVQNCKYHMPYGSPEISGETQMVCHNGYTSYVDLNAKVPRIVMYREAASETLGCLDRLNKFHAEIQLRRGRATSTDYEASGYDLGHNAPDQDMANSYDRLFQSYSMANISPQVPELNRKGWKWLEEAIRSWAMKRGELVIYVGAAIPVNGKTIGKNQVAVPDAFYKVVIDPSTHESIAFMMPQDNIRKDDVPNYRVSIIDIEQRTGILIPVHEAVDKHKVSDMWPTYIGEWRKLHRETCRK